MHTVCDVAHMVFFCKVALPQRRKHLLAHPTVQLADTIYFLTCVAGEEAHAKTLAVILRIFTAHADELVPRNAQHLRVTTHIFAEKGFVKVVVSGRNGRMNSIERR